ncbi:MAG: nitroreductase family protein [Streptococcaceae bacterium]|jgi:nitroreductase|nr:nitroreductase family protein [Streptococcaceae bacterium]
MEFELLNKERHAVRTFDGVKIPTDTIKEILMDAHLAPSGMNIQSWHFVIVEDKNKLAALLEEVKPQNRKQIEEAGAVVVLFGDQDLVARSLEMGEFEEDELKKERLMTRYPLMFEGFSEEYLNTYLSISTGLVTMNLMYVIKNRGYEGNIILEFNRTSKINEILDVDMRYRPELIIPFGASLDTGEASFRFPSERVIEVR